MTGVARPAYGLTYSKAAADQRWRGAAASGCVAHRTSASKLAPFSDTAGWVNPAVLGGFPVDYRLNTGITPYPTVKELELLSSYFRVTSELLALGTRVRLELFLSFPAFSHCPFVFPRSKIGIN